MRDMTIRLHSLGRKRGIGKLVQLPLSVQYFVEALPSSRRIKANLGVSLKPLCRPLAFFDSDWLPLSETVTAACGVESVGPAPCLTVQRLNLARVPRDIIEVHLDADDNFVLQSACSACSGRSTKTEQGFALVIWV